MSDTHLDRGLRLPRSPRNRRFSGGLRIDNLSSARATLLVAASAVGFGLVAYFARSLTDAGVASPAVTFYRWLTSALLLSPFLRFGRAKRGATMWALGAGLGLGLGWVAYVEALSAVPVSTVGVVYMTYPLFAMAAAWALFGQRPGGRSIAGGVMVAGAAALALSPAGVDNAHLGTLLVAFAAPFSFGVAISILTERLIVLDPLERIAAVGLGAVVGVSPLMVSLSASEIIPGDPSAWWLIAGMGLLTSLLPKIGYTLAAPFVGPARTATAGAVELPTMFVLGWLAFGESLGLVEIMAGLLVLAAVALTPSRPPSWDLETKTVRLEDGARSSEGPSGQAARSGMRST